jgi:hypothetical protein
MNYDLNSPLHAKKINSFKTHSLSMQRGECKQDFKENFGGEST